MMTSKNLVLLLVLAMAVLVAGCSDMTGPNTTGSTMGTPEKSSTQATVAIAIDIKPGTYPNMVNLDSQGQLIVAILASPEFDVARVDQESIVFGEAIPWNVNFDDVDDDGDKDLSCHFFVQDLVLSAGNTETCLEAKDLDGVTLLGCDQLGIVARPAK